MFANERTAAGWLDCVFLSNDSEIAPEAERFTPKRDSAINGLQP